DFRAQGHAQYSILFVVPPELYALCKDEIIARLHNRRSDASPRAHGQADARHHALCASDPRLLAVCAHEPGVTPETARRENSILWVHCAFYRHDSHCTTQCDVQRCFDVAAD